MGTPPHQVNETTVGMPEQFSPNEAVLLFQEVRLNIQSSFFQLRLSDTIFDFKWRPFNNVHLIPL